MYLFRPPHPAHAESLQLGEASDLPMVHSAGNGQGGLAKMLMGPEKVLVEGGKAGEASWKGMIGWKEELDDACYICMPILSMPKRLRVAYGTLRPPVACLLLALSNR